MQFSGERLPSMPVALGLIPSTKKNKHEDKKMKFRYIKQKVFKFLLLVLATERTPGKG